MVALTTILLFGLTAMAAPTSHLSPIVYMIRHGEKEPHRGIGLSEAGTWRAQQLPDVFGNNSSYGISYILAEKVPKSSMYRCSVNRSFELTCSPWPLPPSVLELF